MTDIIYEHHVLLSNTQYLTEAHSCIDTDVKHRKQPCVFVASQIISDLFDFRTAEETHTLVLNFNEFDVWNFW